MKRADHERALRRPPRGLVAGLLVLLVATAGCLAPRPGKEGSVEELGQMLSKGAEPVVGVEGEGAAPISGEVHPVGEGDVVPDASQLAPLVQAAKEKQEQEESQAADQEGEEDVDEEPAEEIDPYLRFGERIVVQDREDGVRFVTKPYELPPGKADEIVKLIGALEPFPFGERPAPAPVEGSPGATQRPPHDPNVVYYEILKGWDSENYTNLSAPQTTAPTPVPLGDAMVVTATPKLLAEFESFIDLFGQVPQIELEAKIIEISETKSTDIGVKPPPGVPIFQFGSKTFIRAFDFNLANSVDPTEALLTLGAIQDGLTFNAIIEAVQSWQNVSIESKPKTVVRAGGVARLESTTKVPILEVKSISDTGSFSTQNNYIETGVKLYIAPRIVGSRTLALDVQLEGSQTTGFQNTFTPSVGNAIEAPIISTRSAKSLVYLEPGQTLLIGGLTQEVTTKTEDKVPILGDIPLLGYFFRNHRDVVQRQHVIFAISPRIVQRGDLEIDF